MLGSFNLVDTIPASLLVPGNSSKNQSSDNIGELLVRLPYRTAKLAARICIPILCHSNISKEVDPLPNGSVIVVANHLSNYDMPVLMICVPRRIAFMGGEELFNNRLGHIYRLIGGFPVRRRGIDREAFHKAKRVLEEEWALGIFPEGVKSPSAQLLPACKGMILLALTNDAYILPVGISGTEKVRKRLTGWSLLFRRPTVSIKVGEPFKLPMVEGKPTREQMASLTDLVMMRVAELLPEDYRGVYG